MVQHAVECRLAEDKIRGLESEAETLVSKKNESEKLVAEVGEKIKDLSEAARVAKNYTHDLLEKISRLEFENNNLEEKVQSALKERSEETGALRDDIMKWDQHVESLENQMSDLRNVLNEKEQLHTSLLEREKELEVKKAEIQASLVAAESKLIEERKQFELMLEGKNLELSKPLKELSQRNYQAINDIQRKYEDDIVEVANIEKEKADNLVKEMERKWDEKISLQKEEAQQHLLRVKEENSEMISKIQKDYDQKEVSLQAHQKEELQRIQLQAENELRERTTTLRREHEI